MGHPTGDRQPGQAIQHKSGIVQRFCGVSKTQRAIVSEDNLGPHRTTQLPFGGARGKFPKIQKSRVWGGKQSVSFYAFQTSTFLVSYLASA